MAKNKTNPPIFTLNCAGTLFAPLQPVVMGIVNVTPDSFFEGSRVTAMDAILAKAQTMVTEGALILDIGGQSTRPGSERVGVEEELKRVLEPVGQLAKAFPEIIISIDTYHAAVAEAAVQAGARMVNDVSAGLMDAFLLERVGALGVPYVCMHMKGTPETMQQEPVYENLLVDIVDYFVERLSACDAAGIKDVILDPGFGFGKTIAHNFELLRRLAELRMLQKPLLTGISRKSFIYKTLGVKAENALNGTTALHIVALQQGAAILRVHDVREAVETIRLHKSL
jgi:dihydropteroate synthase